MNKTQEVNNAFNMIRPKRQARDAEALVKLVLALPAVVQGNLVLLDANQSDCHKRRRSFKCSIGTHAVASACG